MNKKIAFLVILCFSQICFPQTDHNQKFQEVYTILFAREYEKAKQRIDFELIASENETDQILGYVALMYYLSIKPERNDQYMQIKTLEKLEQLVNNSDNPRYKAYTDYGYALLYKNLHQKTLFIKAFNKAVRILNQYPDENFLLSNLYFTKTRFLYNTIDREIQLQDFIKNLEYAKKSNNKVDINIATGNLVYYYGYQYGNSKNKKALDSINFYLQKYYRNIPTIGYMPAQKMMLLYYAINSATTLTNEQKMEEATKIFNKVLEENKNTPNTTDIRFAIYNNMGRIAELNKNYQLALNKYLKAYALKDTKELSSFNLIQLNQNISRTYRKTGKYKEALQFEMERDAHIEKESEENNKILDAFYLSEQKKFIFEERSEALQRERYLYIGIIILSAIIIVFLLFLIEYRKKLIKQKNDLLDAEQLRLKAEQELTRKKYMATTLQLSHKNSILTEIKEKTKEYDIDKLLKEEQLCDENFGKLQNTILNIHPDFFHQLKIISNNKLTPMDIKYASFIYLHMDNYQISSYIKSDLNAVRVAKHRLKKKLGITKTESIEDFIQNIKTAK
ncbi:tetratricopeptide (TPR) repeat protein [Chryseobacterium rhizosphaerae]|uniref:tetratricopeptide repeat protein n=1 Tax=Chryseobacterium rhizosphaerae TaxID=395937 RepID=UPI002863BDAB|nr:tetratricopeptide repeat protein [Chryseobacterium rhizosphaerae]MDR6544847.1 tetratricopeptide (TPR) repeat protein [Chryseobacterium rhizosphaerae]